MSIDDLLARLKQVRENGTQSWVACCPAHDDHNPSMSVTAKDGKILLHCHAGCTAEDICAALGIEVRDLFEDSDLRAGGRGPRPKGARSAVTMHSAVPATASARTSSRSGGHGRLVCDYIYRDPDGKAIFKVERRVLENGKKTFIAFHADAEGKNGWTWGIHDRSGGKDRLLVPFVAPYHLPRVIEAARSGKSLIICEGEKDVETVERVLEMAATCNPFGAGKWGIDWPADWGKWFQGLKSILIIADKDAETIKRKKRGKMVEEPFLTGQKHAWDVYRKLQAAGVTAKVRIICLPDVGKAKVKDFTDWVDARRAAKLPADKAALMEAVRAFGDWPAAWQFTDEALEGLSASARADKNGARATSSDGSTDGGSPVAPGEKNAGRDAASPILERFGRLRAPRTPDESVETYEVDFRLSARRFVRLAVSCDMRLPDAMAIMCGRVRAAMGDGESLTAEIVRSVQVVVCVMWLRSRGRFFWDENFRSFETSMFFDRKAGLLMYIRQAEFLSFLATEACENRESKTFKYMLSMIDDAALSREASKGVVPSNLWERRGQAIYISSGDAEMWRILGGKVEKVQNGVDGVVFMRGRTLAPWRLQDGRGVDPFSHAKIFTGASWQDMRSGAMNVRLWMLNLFACHRTKPALLLTGEFQSGKTRMALAIKQILGAQWDGHDDDRIHRMEDGDRGEDSFWVTVDGGKIEIFDNVDSKVKWLGDALQIALTGGSSPRRKKYADKEMITLRANANLILTSNNPLFSTEGGGGLADRLIAVHLVAPKGRESLDEEIAREIEQNRDAYMTWIARTLAVAIEDQVPVDKAINKRHPEYGKFSVRCGRAFGDEMGAVAALGAAEADKSLLPVMNDAVARQILRVLAANGFQLKFTSGEMAEKILAMQGDETDEKTSAMYSARRVGKALSKYSRQLSTLLRMDEPRLLQGRTVYEIRGVSALGLLEGGLVDIGRQFGKTPVQADGQEVSQTSAPNPPNPPTRARADVLPSSREEGGEGDIETMAEMEGFEL